MAREIFHGTIPQGLLYDAEHDMWVRREGDEVVIGATAFGMFLAGRAIAFTAKPVGAEVARGRGLGTVESSKTVLAVHAPISFVLAAGNNAAERRPQLINEDPYGDGWLARGRPLAWDAHVLTLMDATAYRAHVLRMEPDARIEEDA